MYIRLEEIKCAKFGLVLFPVVISEQIHMNLPMLGFPEASF